MFVFLCGINQSCHPICIYTSLNHIYGYAPGKIHDHCHLPSEEDSNRTQHAQRKYGATEKCGSRKCDTVKNAGVGMQAV